MSKLNDLIKKYEKEINLLSSKDWKDKEGTVQTIAVLREVIQDLKEVQDENKQWIKRFYNMDSRLI